MGKISQYHENASGHLASSLRSNLCEMLSVLSIPYPMSMVVSIAFES